MPFDSAGGASLPPVYKVAVDDTVLPVQHNTPLEDIRSMMGNTVVRDGRSPMTGPLNMGANKITNVKAGEDPSDAITLAQAADAAFPIGRGVDSWAVLSSKWLRRNGQLYNVADYPELAAILSASTSAITWTAKTSGSTADLRDAIWHAATSQYVAVGLNSAFLVSAAGETWAPKSIGLTSQPLSGVTVFQNAVIAVAASGGRVFRTTDTTAFTSFQVTISGTTNVIFNDVAASASEVIAVGRRGADASSSVIARSTTGLSGSFAEITPPVGIGEITAIDYGGGLFTIVTATGAVATSPTGTTGTWTTRVSNVATALRGVRYTSLGWVAYGDNGVIITSPNATTDWTVQASGTSSALYGGTINNGRLLIVGAGGTARTGTDITAWNTSVTGTTAAFYAAIPVNGALNAFLVFGDAGSIRRAELPLPTQFAVPNDKPDNGWIKALS